MSFVGTSSLGNYGWGTTVTEALNKQFTYIRAAKLVAGVVADDNKSASSIPEPQDDKIILEKPIRSACLFHDDAHEWTAKQKHSFYVKKKKNESETVKMRKEIEKWQQTQQHLLEAREAKVEKLSPLDRKTLDGSADLISKIVINLYIREILLLPLARDQLDHGWDLFNNCMQNNKILRQSLRHLRKLITDEVDTGFPFTRVKQWRADMDACFNYWNDHWQWELKNVIEPLSLYLKNASISETAARDYLTMPSPTPNHDYNYGQQIIQMWIILRIYHRRSGYLQGIPKPRHQPDWNCLDGFGDLSRLAWGSESVLPEVIEQHPAAILHDNPGELPSAASVKSIKAKRQLQNIGECSDHLTKRPDYKSEDQRKQLMQMQKQEISQQEKAITMAHRKKYKLPMVEKFVFFFHWIYVFWLKIASAFCWAWSCKHTPDLDGSFNKNEVKLALRNHGTHFEALTQDITPTGNHYLLIHFDAQQLNADTYKLKVHGCVEHPTSWSLKDIQGLAPDQIIRQPVVMECSGNGRTLMQPRFNHHVPWELQAFGCYVWTGLPIKVLLHQVGITSDAVDVVFTGYDSGVQENALRYYQRAVSIDDPVLEHMMVTWENNGQPLLREHGYPLRIITPGWYGDNSVKWLQSIEVMDHRFTGRHMVSYSYSTKHFDLDISVPSQEIRPRAMICPPGVPSFMERNRFITAGSYHWIGKAWIGGGYYRAVTTVEISLDDGKTWTRAKLEPRLGIFGWHKFTVPIKVDVGVYEVRVRAAGPQGDIQKAHLTSDDWNYHGMCDDACQYIKLIVVDKMIYTT